MASQYQANNTSIYCDPLELLQLLLEAPLPPDKTKPPVRIVHPGSTPELMKGGIPYLLRALLDASPALAASKPSSGRGPRHARIHLAGDDLRLLQALLEALPPPAVGRMPPIALRSTKEQRRLVLGSVPPASRFDALLLRTQQLLLVAAVLVAGYWFVDGPLYDWLHTPRMSSGMRASDLPRTAVAHNVAPLNAGGPSSVSRLSNGQPRRAQLSAQGPPTAAPTSAVSSPSSVSKGSSPTLPEDTPLSWRAQATALAASTHMSAASAPASPAPARAALTPSQQIASDMTAPSPEPIQPIVLPVVEPTHLIIPSIGVDTPVVEVFVVDGEWQTAEYAAGYMHGSALAGEAGNMAISGHLGLRGGVFANLAALQPGADIYVDAAGWRYHYLMRNSQVVWPTQVEVLYPEETPTLTLLTCTNWDTQRLVVTADLMEARPLEAH